MTTRGPHRPGGTGWRVTDPAGGPRVRDAAGTVIARVYLRPGYMQVAEMIAAAPVMLEALEAIAFQTSNSTTRTIARAAIVEARGRTPMVNTGLGGDGDMTHLQTSREEDRSGGCQG